MKRITRIGAALALALAGLPLVSACNADNGGSEEQVADTGSVSMALSSFTNGTEYRLTNAVFVLDGPTSTLLASSNDPSETVLSAVLATGDYTSTLEDGWLLQRNDGGTFVTVQASLVSGNPVVFTVIDGQNTSLVYQFNTDGTIITIGTGTVDISVQVNETTTGAMCEPFGPGCSSGEWCVPGSVVGTFENICVESGSIPVGGACDGSLPCVTNALCGDLGTGMMECIELCPGSAFGMACAGGGGVCSDFGFPEAGVCL